MTWIDANNSRAALLAGTTEVSSLNVISTNTTVGHNSFINEAFLKRTQIQISSPREIGIGKVASFKASFSKIGVFEDGGSKIDIIKANLSERSISKINPWHITIFKSTFIHTGADEFSKAQVTFVEPTGIEVGVGEVGLLVNNSFNDFIPPVSTLKVPASLISFSPSVLSNQFFSIHDSTPKLINNLNNKATNIWADLSSAETYLNINIQIANLSTRYPQILLWDKLKEFICSSLEFYQE